MQTRSTELLVTIDTERDYGPRWETPPRLGFRGVTEAIPRLLAPLFGEFGVRPTYLLSPEVIAHPACRDVLAGLDDCELGTHLHVEYVVPRMATWDFDDPSVRVCGMQWECSRRLEREKLEVLTELFHQQFDRQPRSFRAGRFGIGRHTGKALMELGYAVDSSVTPHVCWTSAAGRKRPDFRGARELPYRVAASGNLWRAGKSTLLEVPVTVLRPGTIASAPAGEPTWFRPWYSTPEVLCEMVRHAASLPTLPYPRPLVMMFHAMELIPGCTPYPQTEEDVQTYLASLRSVFQAVAEAGIASRTLNEYYREFMEAAP